MDTPVSSSRSFLKVAAGAAVPLKGSAKSVVIPDFRAFES
jgi:hypothetical protein